MPQVKGGSPGGRRVKQTQVKPGSTPMEKSAKPGKPISVIPATPQKRQ